MSRNRKASPFRRLGRLAVFVSSSMAAAGVAQADSPGPGYWLYDGSSAAPFQRGQLYGSFDLKGGVQHMPRFSSPYAFGPLGFGAVTQRGLSNEENLRFVQPGGTIGFAFQDGTFPAWMGGRVRVALSGSYVSGWKQRNTGASIPATGTLQVSNVGGTSTVGATYAGFTDFAESLRIEREGFNLALRIASDMPISPNLSLTPSIGAFGGRTTDTYKYFANISGGGVFAVPYNLDEVIRTREIGADLGLAATWQFAPGWALNLGGTGAIVWSRSTLNASDCVNLAVTPAGGCGPSNVGFIASSASDTRSTIGFRGTGTVALSADLRYAVLTIGGFARYDSRIPGVSNPQLANTTAVAQVTGPARIFFDSGFAFGGMLNLRVPIY